MRTLPLLAAAILFINGESLRAEDPKASLPKVVLLGDSIRLSYAPTVAKLLEGKVELISPKPNGGDSSNLLKNLDEWAIKPQPEVIHFNCGIHDMKKTKGKEQFQVSPEQYEANLRKIVERLRKETKAKVIFAVITPVIDERAAPSRAKADYELLEASAQRYNEIARKVMKELDVPVNDLRALMPDMATRDKLMSGDGIHFTGEGAAKLGAQVADIVSKHLPVKPKQ